MAKKNIGKKTIIKDSKKSNKPNEKLKASKSKIVEKEAEKVESLETRKSKYWILIPLIIIAAFFAYQNFNTEQETQKNPLVSDIVYLDDKIVSYKYNNFQFENNNGIWNTEIEKGKQPYIISFTYGPLNVSHIFIEYAENSFPMLTKPGKNVYVTFDHTSNQTSYIATSSINLIANMKTVWGLNLKRACTVNSTECQDAPVITCESRPNNAVIQFFESDYTKVLYKDNCLSIWGNKREIIKATERIILDWYDIM